MTDAIRITQLSKQFDRLKALDEVSFDIPRGSFFGLLGPNGAGKSTLINIMAGLSRASSGHISVLGYDVLSNWRKARFNLGVVPQELVYDPFFTVREMLYLQSGYFGFSKENHAWVEELMESFSLADKADTNMQKLSGGMKRRVLIAQALVHKPEVVVLDEPTAGVDVELRRALWQFTRDLHAKGHTILLTTHYLEEAQALCKRIAILNQGKLVALDDTKDLLNHHPYRVLCLKLPDHKLPNLPDALQAKVLERNASHISLQLHREQDNIIEVLAALQQAGIAFTDLHTKEPDLEDVFLNLTANTQTRAIGHTV